MPDNGHMLVVIAHPDDESFGCGSTILEAVRCGFTATVCCASLGEAGEPAPGFELHGRPLAAIRHDELRAAAGLLGADVLPPLGLLDSGWDGSPEPGSICGVSDDDLTRRLRTVIAQQQPDIVLTLAGDDGHRDHQRLAVAVPAALADQPDIRQYQWCLPNTLMRRWAGEVAALRPDTAHLALEIARLGTPAERITTVIDTTRHLPLRRRAVAAHSSQTSPYEGLSADLAEAFLTSDHLVRLA